MTATAILQPEKLRSIFPPERTDAFFDALFGGAEEGAYDIHLELLEATPQTVTLGFMLTQRPGKCLVCSLTHGLPQVFQRHPIINTPGVVADVAQALGWDPAAVTWELGRTREHSSKVHVIPLLIQKK